LSCGSNNDSIYGVWKVFEHPEEGSFPREIQGKTYQPLIEISKNFVREYVSVTEDNKTVITYRSKNDQTKFFVDEKERIIFDGTTKNILVNYNISGDVLTFSYPNGQKNLRALRASKADIVNAVDQAATPDHKDK
jgi:hypothetical protein